MDARTKPEFYGLEGPAPAFNAPESSPQRQTHRFGSKSIPAEDLVKPDGKIYSPNELSISELLIVYIRTLPVRSYGKSYFLCLICSLWLIRLQLKIFYN